MFNWIDRHRKGRRDKGNEDTEVGRYIGRYRESVRYGGREIL